MQKPGVIPNELRLTDAKLRSLQQPLRYSQCNRVELIRFIEDRAGLIVNKKAGRAQLTA